MNSLFAISGQNVVYAHKLIKSNGLPFTPGTASLWMPCGRFFPVSHAGMAIIEYFQHPVDIPFDSYQENYVLGILATPNGLLYEYLASAGTVVRRIIPRGHDLRYCRSNDIVLEEAMTAAMECCDNLVDAMNLVAKSRKLLLNTYKYTLMTDVYAEMQERKITKQPIVRTFM